DLLQLGKEDRDRLVFDSESRRASVNKLSAVEERMSTSSRTTSSELGSTGHRGTGSGPLRPPTTRPPAASAICAASDVSLHSTTTACSTRSRSESISRATRPELVLGVHGSDAQVKVPRSDIVQGRRDLYDGSPQHPGQPVTAQPAKKNGKRD